MKATRPGESALLLLDVIDLLAPQNLAYAVIGAMAASVHGVVRASMDADVVISLGVSEAKRLADLFAARFQTELTRGDPENPIPAMLKVTGAFDNRVDLLIGLHGLDPQAFSRAIEIPFQGEILKFIGREDFIAMKVFAGGPIDLMDASRAIAAGGSNDLELIRRLAKRFGERASEPVEELLKS